MSPNRLELMRFRRNMLGEYAKVIEDGKTDGSIRPDLDAEQGVSALVFMLTGFLLMLAEAGGTGDFGLGQENFVHYALDLLGDAVRAK